MNTPQSQSIPLLIHSLSVWPEDDNPRACRIRATVRSGSPAPGDRLWFEALDRVKRELKITAVKETPRLCTIWLEGEPKDLEAFEPGLYLHGMDHDGPAG